MRKIFQKLGLCRKSQYDRRRASPLKSIFQGLGQAQPERLEQRRMLAVDVVASPVVAGMDNWVSVVADNDDVYVQHVANSDRDLYVANNGAFVGAHEFPQFLSQYDSLNIYEGKLIQETNIQRPNRPFPNEATADTLVFEVPYGYIDPLVSDFEGELVIDGQRYSFSNNGAGTSLNSSSLSSPIIMTLSYGHGATPSIFGVGNAPDVSGNPQIITRVRLQHPEFPEIIGSQSSVELNLFRFDIDEDFRTDVFSELDKTYASSTGLIPVADPGTQQFGFSTVNWADGQYVPGTLNGDVTIQVLGTELTYSFQADELNPTDSESQVPLSFSVVRDDVPIQAVNAFYNGGGGVYNDNITQFSEGGAGGGNIGGNQDTSVRERGVSVEGAWDPISGTISLNVFYENSTTAVGLDGNVDGITRTSTEIGANIIVNRLDAGWYNGSNHQPVRAAVFPGLTHSVGLNVELPTAGSSVVIDSPVVTTGTAFGQGDVRLAASDIKVDSPVSASQTIIVPKEEDTALGTISEQLHFNATTTSPTFTIHLADDPETTSVSRSQLVVAQSGSLSNTPGSLNAAPTVFVPSTSSFIEVVDGDAFIEGTVSATLQSFVMSSDVGSEAEAPYFLTTRSRLTGIDLGSVVGDTLSLTLGNDTLGESFLSLATSEVSLSTQVNRLRTQSASRVADPLREMFPYKLIINEQDDLIIDAVAGSSEEISIDVGGSLSLLGAIRSQHDVALESVADFQVSAPISTSFGSVSLTGPNVTVNSPIRILDAIQDERIVDVRIEATSPDGGLVLNDAISALNRVELISAGFVQGSARVRGDVVDVDALGDVSFATAANLVTVDSPSAVRVEEEGAAAFEIRQSTDVTLIANGHDKLVDHDSDPSTDDVLSPALYADVYSTSQIVASAPNGSVDVLHRGSQELTVGDPADINAGIDVTPGSSGMLAGGSAIIRSTLSPEITVLDFPSSLSGAERVELATTAPLPADSSYSPGQGEPGTYATRLDFKLPYDASNRLAVLDRVLATNVRVGDRILVKDGRLPDPNAQSQDIDHIVNGIYVLLKVTYNANSSMSIVAVRATTHDETPELRDRSYVVVTGVSDPESRADATINLLAGKAFAANGFEVVNPLVNNTGFNDSNGVLGQPATPLEVRAVPSQPGYTVANAMTTASIGTQAVFSEGNEAGDWIDYIEATENGSIADLSNELFGGVVLIQDDLVLVRESVTAGVNEPNPGELANAAIGLYRVDNPGAANSKWKLVRYRGVDETGDTQRNQIVEGIVTIAGGLQRTAVTGEMFEMRYRSLHNDALNYQELTDYIDVISFDRESPSATVIPAFDTNANVRTDIGMDNPNGVVQYEISTEGSTNSTAGSFGRMLGVIQSNSAYVPRTKEPQQYTTAFSQSVTNIVLDQQLPTIRKQVQLAPSHAVSIDGSEITETRDGAIVPTGTITAGIGPVRPSRVYSSRRLVRSEDIGNIFLNGLEFGPGSDGSQVSNLTIGGFNNGAAVFIGGAGNVLVDGVTLGQDSDGGPLPNQYGVYVMQVAGGSGTDFTTITDSTIESSTSSGIYLGVNSNNVRVVANSEIGRVIANDIANEDRRGNVVGLTNNSVQGRNLIGAAPILDAIDGIATIARQNKLVLPDTFNPDDIYLGQGIIDYSGSTDVIDEGTVITEINRLDDGRTRVTLSLPLKSTEVVSISLVASVARNQIQFNSDGVILESGSSRMVATDVTNSVFDGVTINGVADDGQHVIGGVEYAGVVGQNIPNRDNVAVHSNGLSGIKFTDAFFAGLAEEQKIEKVNQIKIRGNFLGTNIDNDPSQTNGRDGASNIIIQQSLDSSGNATANDSNANIRAILLEDASPLDNDPRDAGLYYTARYREENNPLDNPLLEDREGIDAEGNGQVTGAPLTGTFPGGGGSGTTDPDDPRGPSAPPTMR